MQFAFERKRKTSRLYGLDIEMKHDGVRDQKLYLSD